MTSKDAGGSFLTQKGEKISEVKKDIAELEELLSGNVKTNQSTLLLKKRKEMREVDEALELMKQEYKRRMDGCEERRESFEAKQQKMRDQVIKFEKYIQENDAKRLRAEMKAKQEHKMYEQKCQELEQLGQKISELQIAEKQLQADLISKNSYTSYLEVCLETTRGDGGGFEEVSDLLKRYYTLKQSNYDLMLTVQKQEKSLDVTSGQHQSLRTEQQNQLLVNNSALQSYQKKLEEVRKVAQYEEEEKNRFEDVVKATARESSQVIQSVKNIWMRCCNTMRNPIKISTAALTSEAVDVMESNLELIESRLVDLIEITREYTTDGDKFSESMEGGLDGGMSASTTLTGAASKANPTTATSASGTATN